jgi:hypothetical protein
MTSECHPYQAHSATVDRHVPIVITPDVVSSSTSEAVACCMPSTLWDTRRKELATYKQVNGHTNVPQRCPSNKPLGNWVKNQRQHYKLFREGKTSTMTTERIKSLNELDFDWSPGKEKKALLCTLWDTRRKKLATYKQVNGHTNVSTLDATNKPLGNWVAQQRHQYKLLQDGKTSHMTPERIKSLNELDFDWRWDALLQDNKETTVWEQRLQELATYKYVNGHTNVPRSNKPLGNWVKAQRQHYKLFFREGKNSQMTTERIESLNELDFEWSSRKDNSTLWEQRLQELATYKQVNGHTNVLFRCTSNKPLGNWVGKQRSQYKLFREGKKSQMTEERIESLNELDFEWSSRKAKAKIIKKQQQQSTDGKQ